MKILVIVYKYSKIQTNEMRYHVFVYKYGKTQTNAIVQNICKTTNRIGNTKTVYMQYAYTDNSK